MKEYTNMMAADLGDYQNLVNRCSHTSRDINKVSVYYEIECLPGHYKEIVLYFRYDSNDVNDFLEFFRFTPVNSTVAEQATDCIFTILEGILVHPLD